MSAEAESSARSAWGRMLACVLVVIGIDQATKALVVERIEIGERNEVLPFLDFVHVVNDGVAFGLLGDSSRGVVLLVTVAALGLVLGWFAFNKCRPLAWLAVGLLAGGAIGNLIDRLARDGVVDFIDFPLWPSFNVADIAITLGAGTLAIIAMTAPGPNETAAEESPRGAG
ncbi:MAG TPA: signal peptidase II [Solirubrobacterales bacterium]|nr:signal peptidase II [Solirubrobacterales bacterium]